MQEIVKIIIGIIVVLIGIPIGNLLAKVTREELKKGQKWFRIVIVLSIIGAIISLIVRNDPLFFSFLFIAAVTNGSLKRRSLKK